MFSTLEGELPRTRGPNPLFWTHTLAHLSLASLPPPSDYLQLTLSPFSPRVPYALVVPTAAFPAFYTALRLLLSPTADTAHCPECCVVASPGVLSPPPLALFPPVLHVQFCITIRRALRKLPRNFSLPRARDRLFQPSPPSPFSAGQLRAGSINSLSLIARTRDSSGLFFVRSSQSFRYRYAPRRCVSSPD